tara:strand:- start:5545 stop:6765 length:1221 start_codon:yes stop_codon:yes gene_type:complete
MANGIDRRYTGIPIIPQVVEEETSIWDTIAPLAQMARQEKARQEALKLKWEGIRQKDEQAADLKQYRSDELSQRKAFQQEQNRLAQDRISVDREQMEYVKAEESEREEYSVINQIGDWKTKSEKLRELSTSTNKKSYDLMADEIEKNGIAKEAISPIYMNLTSEDNPYKIREYLLRDGLELDKHFKGASDKLRRRADDLDLKYSVKEASVLKSKEYQGLLVEHENLYGPQYKPKVSMDTWNAEHQKIKARAADLIQSPITAQGIMPISEDDMAAIWSNPEARDYWLMNPADDLSDIKKRYKMVEEEGEADEEPKKDIAISGLEKEVIAYEEAGLTGLKGYAEAKKELKLKESKLDRQAIDDKIKELAMSVGESEDVIRKKMLIKTKGKLYQMSPTLSIMTDLMFKE